MSILVTVPTEELAAAIGPVPGDVDLRVWPMDGPPPGAAEGGADIAIAVPPYMSLGPALSVLRGLPDVRIGLLQGQAIGYEGIADRLPAGSVFANAATVHETSTAELALALTLAAQRGIPGFVRDQDRHAWTTAFHPSLADRRVLLLGYGGVGKAIAARLLPFEVDLVPVASHARDEDGVHVHGIDELTELLPTAEIAVLALPGGDGTRHVMDAAALALLPDGALVVNVGRDTLVDTDALVREVASGRLRAALDVVDPEPLPADHPLWDLEGALIAPHVGGASTAMLPRMAALVRRQIDHVRAGEEPENIVILT